eukprot:TRINITY_DN10654_c0_g1_i2.p2 TRINITY_DN10654_c0_g1~~TRINITY_DN10654_c0_g1_i2.p2  ORF type:complete len:125 (-),score=21.88 TRINITY_DN10654_c0_g1_i2:34-408(-)
MSQLFPRLIKAIHTTSSPNTLHLTKYISPNHIKPSRTKATTTPTSPAPHHIQTNHSNYVNMDTLPTQHHPAHRQNTFHHQPTLTSSCPAVPELSSLLPPPAFTLTSYGTGPARKTVNTAVLVIS